MIYCDGCPFSFIEYIEKTEKYVSHCNIGYKTKINRDKNPTSEDCILSVVTYALADKKESISFIPEEVK